MCSEYPSLSLFPKSSETCSTNLILSAVLAIETWGDNEKKRPSVLSQDLNPMNLTGQLPRHLMSSLVFLPALLIMSGVWPYTQLNYSLGQAC